MNEIELVKIFKCLSDKSRVLILKSLAKEEMYVERLAERLGLAPATVSFHIKKLEEIKAIKSRKEQYYTIYSLCPEIFSFRIIDFLMTESINNKEEERDNIYRENIINTFMEYGKVKKLPAQRKKKNIILEEIVKSFQFDRLYTEKEVNLIIADFNDDFCTIRREMIMVGLMKRKNEIYQKISEKVNYI